jgi:hypothetical protein
MILKGLRARQNSDFFDGDCAEKENHRHFLVEIDPVGNPRFSHEILAAAFENDFQLESLFPPSAKHTLRESETAFPGNGSLGERRPNGVGLFIKC